MRYTLNLIHDLAARGVGIRNLSDPIKVDSANPDDPMAQLAVVLLALFAQMERTYSLERAAGTSLYRHLPPRPAEASTAAGTSGPPPRPDSEGVSAR